MSCSRLRLPLRPLAALLVLLTVAPVAGQEGSRLCSSGPRDGQPCAASDACPGGACVVVQGVCEGGRDDGLDCDCPGGTCNTATACPSTPGFGTCQGGPFSGECCDPFYRCSGGAPCRSAWKVCLSGELRGFSCLVEDHCEGSPCLASGLVCDGDGFSCIVDEDCVAGPCVGQGVPPTPPPSPLPTATPTRLPTLAPACPGDCSGNGEVTVDELIRLVNIALEAAPLDTCPSGDRDGNGVITVNEIIAAVNLAILGCEI